MRFTIEDARELLKKADLFYGFDDDEESEDPRDKQTLNMNDTWGWATGFGVYVPDEQLPEVARLFWDYGWCGVLYWVSITNNNMKSEFSHINRMVEFVSNEEVLYKSCKSLSEYAYKKASYKING